MASAFAFLSLRLPTPSPSPSPSPSPAPASSPSFLQPPLLGTARGGAAPSSLVARVAGAAGGSVAAVQPQGRCAPLHPRVRLAGGAGRRRGEDHLPFLEIFQNAKLMASPAQIHTLCIGAAAGHACLVLAAGKKGKRYMFPHAKAMIQQPRIPSYGMMQASDVVIRAKEVVHNRNTLVRLLARHTGNPPEKIDKVMRGPFYMDSLKAKEFGGH